MYREKELQELGLELSYYLMMGGVNGFTSTLVSHPFDTIKTKLQAQKEFMHEANLFSTIRDVWAKEGIRGFYKGAIPPFIGSILFRSLPSWIFLKSYMYEDFMDKIRNLSGKKEIPGTFDQQYKVAKIGVIASSVRAVLECPFEYAKVKRQTGQSWNLRAAYKGFGILYIRTVGMLTSYFIFMDLFIRNTKMFGTMTGTFLISGLSGSLAWILIWPLENIKNIIQAESQNVGNSWMEKFHWMIKTHGFVGLYRGMLPGVAGVFLRNGVSMVAMKHATHKLREFKFPV